MRDEAAVCLLAGIGILLLIVCPKLGSDQLSEPLLLSRISIHLMKSIFLFLWSTTLAQAQSFCDLDGAELLNALEGNWSVNQGPGTANAAGMVMPLPPQPSTALSFTYHDSEKASLVTGRDIPTETFLFPLADVDHPPSEAFIAALGAGPTGGDCDLTTAPLLTATNVSFRIREYQFRNEFTQNTCIIAWAIGGRLGTLSDEDSQAAWLPGGGDDDKVLADCRTAERTVGGVKTTMIIRFTGPEAGHGVVIFEGTADGGGQTMSFIGSAPITLGR